ncbi:MAG TPA: biotin--[acetyl-CoA-carboxylase] ligase [Solirubrobacteraceae bacterium]|nr:biotin--[acetyl-CoA-carboxylase] ligase [Solirubrobacteraceae bacterium]
MTPPPPTGGEGASAPHAPVPAAAPPDAPGAALGFPRLHLYRTDSTNLRARELAAAGAPHGTLVTASEQTAGRGRQGRTWLAPPRSSVLMSLVLRDGRPLLSLAAGVAVATTAERLGAADVGIKWPNDVWIAGAKTAGILVEARPQDGWAVLGIGLNVALGPEDLPADLQGRATSLGLDPEDTEAVLRTLLGELRHWLSKPASGVLEAVRARDALLGRTVHWQGGSGDAVGIGDEGQLLVDTASGRIGLDAGEVHLSLG